MAEILIVGDGPAGLSAALLLAKNGQSVTVFGTDQTPMHKAHLYNYLGLPDITGSDFQKIARAQVEAKGATIVDVEVTEVTATDGGYQVTCADGTTHGAKYLILATGSKRGLAERLGAALDEQGVVVVTRDGRTSLPDCYALGWTSRKHKTQAVIAAGEGAAAALDILSAEMGKEFHDFDVVEAG